MNKIDKTQGVSDLIPRMSLIVIGCIYPAIPLLFFPWMDRLSLLLYIPALLIVLHQIKSIASPPAEGFFLTRAAIFILIIPVLVIGLIGIVTIPSAVFFGYKAIKDKGDPGKWINDLLLGFSSGLFLAFLGFGILLLIDKEPKVEAIIFCIYFGILAMMGCILFYFIRYKTVPIIPRPKVVLSKEKKKIKADVKRNKQNEKVFTEHQTEVKCEDKLKTYNPQKEETCFWSVDVGRNVELFDGNIPLLGGFDRKHFREDVYLLHTAKNDPDKLISLLHEFNNIYIWPALAISMITFPDPQDTTKFSIHKSTSTKAVPTRIDNSEKVWDMTSKASVPNWMLSLPDLSFLNFNWDHISYWKNDIYEKIFSKNLPWQEFVDLITKEVLFDTEQDPVLDFSKVIRTEFNGEDPISGSIMAPIYNNAHELKAIIYIAYPRRNVMEGITLFDYKCVLDMQFLLKILSLCFE